MRPPVLPLIAFVLLAACSPAQPEQGSRPQGQETAPAAGAPPRTLTMVVRYEVTDLAPKIPGSSNPSITKRLFNAQLTLVDATGTARPYLAEALPELNTASWRVHPDGRMETTYRLRPGLSWHDGAPLTADDFVFAYRVYTSPAVGVFQPTPQDQMEEVTAPDQQTVFIRWRSPNPDAGTLIEGDLDPLPRHLLEPQLAAVEQDAGARDQFIGDPFWTTAYVGAGPFRMELWEPGSHFEAIAFPGHALGRPKIDRLIVRIINDENTTLTNVLAGNVDYTAFLTLRFEHAQVLQRDWVAANRGVVLLRQGGPVTLLVQTRPEYAEPAALLDVRVRRALAHGIDRDALNQGVFEGQGFISEGFVPKGVAHYAEAERAIMRYPYDPRRAEQLMTEAGFTRDREGLFTNAAGERFAPDFRATGGTEFERMQAILADTWRRAGFQLQPSVLAVAQARDRQLRHTFPALASRGGLSAGERTWTSAEIGTAANRWSGENRGGWANPEYDRQWAAFSGTLDRPTRTRQIVDLLRLLSEQTPVYMLYFSVQVMTHTRNLRGPEAGTAGSGSLVLETLPHWNIHEWELQ